MPFLIPVVRVKPGFAWTVYAAAGFRILAAIDAAAKMVGVDLTLTAGTNDHTAGRHVTGEAFDVSVHGLPVHQIVKLRAFLAQTLGERFTVLYECPTLPSDPLLAGIAFVNPEATGSHLHVQVSKHCPVYPPLEKGPYAA